MTAHDGFTLNDLVSYNRPHNEANGENNADGHRHNLSWNCGLEGPTDDPRGRRLAQAADAQFPGDAVPVARRADAAAGDEFARTQRGNNNAYCQDNEISWIDWSLCAANADLVDFVRLLASVRRATSNSGARRS